MSEYGDEPEGTFSIFFAEGEALAKQRQYKKAIESFTKVLKLSGLPAPCFQQSQFDYYQLFEQFN
jgi:hypothetical protein